MIVRRAQADDLDAWATLRADLWPDGSTAEHRAEAADMLGDSKLANFVAETPGGTLAGFAEAALRHDYVNGCDTTPVAFVEGIYVAPDYRKADIARALCEAIAAWGREQECTELASDALEDNVQSHAFHRAIGFEETERVVYFRRML